MTSPFTLLSDSPIFLPGATDDDATSVPGLQHGTLALSEPGLLILHCESTRPLKLWIGRHLVLDDQPQRNRTYIYRRMLLAATVPLEVGNHAIRVETGIPSRHISWVDEHCEAPRRADIIAEVFRQLPDGVTLSARFLPRVTGPAVALHFANGQFRKNGILWQDTRLRPLAGFTPFPQPWASWEEKEPDFTPQLTTPIPDSVPIVAVPFAERPITERRVYVPVWQGDPPMARQPGHDSRVESMRAVVGEVPLTISDPSGSITLPMPVFEILGRRAPVREHSEIAPPDPTAVLAAAPHPILPDAHSGWLEMHDEAFRLLCRLWQPRPPESGLPGGYLRTAENGFVDRQFVWDTCFTTLATAYAHRAFPARASLDALYVRQDDGGMIEREFDTRDTTAMAFEPGFGVNPPLFAQAEWAIARLDGNRDRLRVIRPVLESHFEWLWHNRRLPDGTFWTTGLANGLDNSPGQGEAYPCLTAQMIHFAEFLVRFARLDDDEKAAALHEDRRRLTAVALETHLWDECKQIYSASLPDGGHNPHKIITAFWPLWAGCAQPERVAALRAHLEDPASFNRPHPIPTLAADSPLYRPPGDYWRGSVWSPTNVAALLGFWRAGEPATARAFATRHLDAMLRVFRETDGGLWENYAPESIAQGSWSQKNYSWTAASPITLLYEVLLGLEPDALANTLTWTLPAEPGFGVENYPLGRAMVSLLLREGSVEVSTDAPSTLVLRAENQPADAPPLLRRDLPAGHHTLPIS